MKKITPVLLGLIPFFLALLFLVLPARAENWVEVSAVGGEQTFYDSDSSYIDIATGLVVINTAVWLAGEDDYSYALLAYDCSRWEQYVLGFIMDGIWQYDTYGELEVNYISDPTSPAEKLAQWACNNYNNHPSGNIPFDFILSNY